MSPTRRSAEDGRLPFVELPTLPPPGRLWSRALVVAYVLLGIFLLDRLAILLMDYWLFESLGFEDVWWTNFRTGAALFAIALVAVTAAVAVPAFVHGLERPARRKAIWIGLFFGLISAHLFSGAFRTYLLWFNGQEFGQADPIYDKDVGFYVFDLPGIFKTLTSLLELLVIALVSSIVCAWIKRPRQTPERMSRPLAALGAISSPMTLALLLAIGIVSAVEIWFTRYNLLTKDNYDSSIPNGAQFLDVSGFFSTKNAITVSAIVAIVTAIAIASRLRILNGAVVGRPPSNWRRRLRPAAILLVLLPGAVVEIAFVSLVALRDQIDVTPNEPVVQFPYIQHHIDATNRAFGIDDIEHRELVPKGPGDPPPDLDRLLDHPTIRNAPLWPGYNSWLERQIDPEYTERIIQTGGDATIYGPTLATFQQQEKLRPYYDFMDVDTVRYRVRGEKTLVASSVRELPLLEPQPWLAWWGQRFVVFTHGFGLVAAKLAGADPRGEPEYVARGIPSRSTIPSMRVGQQAVYYGEGSGSMGYSNVRRIKEHDYPTDQGRAEVSFPEDVDAGVEIDSLAKKLVFGWKSRQFVDIVFSDLIDDDTRVHYFRTPLERIERVAPFLYLDTDPYAVAAENGVHWMVNGMTTSNNYPYSARAEIGDKSDRRTPTRRPTRWVNYVADSVKGVVDAYTGKVQLYKFANEPVLNAWADIYPDLFEDQASLPDDLRDQVQYPVQLMHVQFDDLYIFYHQKDPLTFFSQEDLFDDGDEVVGPILDEGRAIAFSIEPYYWLAETGRDLPASQDPEQFALSMVFTPENALNLRAIATAYMDTDADYGKLSMLEVPKGRYFPGPEQADSAIDQDAFISQQLGLWTRRGLEVIRGHTTPLVIDGEVIYIEPVFIRSKQNPVPQLKRVIVVFRGQAAMGETLEGALRAALDPSPRFEIRPGPELGGEPGFVERGGRLDRTGPLTREEPPDVEAVDEAEEPRGEGDDGGGGPPPGAGPPAGRGDPE